MSGRRRGQLSTMAIYGRDEAVMFVRDPPARRPYERFDHGARRRDTTLAWEEGFYEWPTAGHAGAWHSVRALSGDRFYVRTEYIRDATCAASGCAITNWTMTIRLFACTKCGLKYCADHLALTNAQRTSADPTRPDPLLCLGCNAAVVAAGSMDA